MISLKVDEQALSEAAEALDDVLLFRETGLKLPQYRRLLLQYLQAELETKVKDLIEEFQSETKALQLIEQFGATPIKDYPYEPYLGFRLHCYDSDIDSKEWAVATDAGFVLKSELESEDDAELWVDWYLKFEESAA